MSEEVKKGETTIRYEMQGVRVAMQDYLQKETTMIGRIYTPQGQTAELAKALIVAVGPDVKHIKVGDVVVTPFGIGTHLTDGEKKYRVLPEESCMAVDLKFNEEEECEPIK